MDYRSNFADDDMDFLFDAMLTLKDKGECYRLFEDLCTIKELKDMAQRLKVAKMLRNDKPYHEISEETHMSTATISRINKALNYGTDGYALVLDRMTKKKQ